MLKTNVNPDYLRIRFHARQALIRISIVCMKLVLLSVFGSLALTACTNDKPHTAGVSELSSMKGKTDADLFDGDGALIGFTTNNASAVPDIARKDGRYHAQVLTNEGGITVHFNNDQGRLDARKMAFPFEFIARNIGIGTLVDSQIPPSPDDFPSPEKLIMFSGIQVHVLDLEKRDSAHMVVGHRGPISFTIEGKNTRKGKSSVNDAGKDIVPLGRADLRVVGDADKKLSWFWQQPNMSPSTQPDDWIAYRDEGSMPGRQTRFGDEVYVGLITYAYGQSSTPFVGTADSIEWTEYVP